MNGITRPEAGDIVRLQWNMPVFTPMEHPQDGLYILLEGQAIWQDCSETHLLHRGDLLFVRRGSYAISTGMPSQLLWIPLSSAFLGTFLQRFGALLSEMDRVEVVPSPLLRFSTSPLLNQSVDGLCAMLGHGLPAALMPLRIEELLLLLAFSDQGSHFLAMLRQLGNRQVERLQVFMESHYLKEWKLSEFAREFGMGLTTFKELFGSVYGVSPRAWISERRILYAHQLLLNSEMSIVDIAMEAGFSSQSYFTQSYRRRFGCTPSRSRHGKE